MTSLADGFAARTPNFVYRIDGHVAVSDDGAHRLNVGSLMRLIRGQG